MEVLSPSNTVDEITEKMFVCLENGCSSFWIIDPKRQRVSVTEGDVTKHYDISASISSDVAGATISVREIFE